MENLFDQNEAGIPKKILKIEDIPGLSKFFNFPSLSVYLLSIFSFTFGT